MPDYTDTPLTISGTTVVRAKAFLPDPNRPKTATASYLFVNDIVQQSPNGQTPAGFPNSWGANAKDYGMDPAIVNSPTWGPRMRRRPSPQIPSISMVMDTDDLFGSQGIYSHARLSGQQLGTTRLAGADRSRRYEEGFQVNAGVRIRGGFSRSNSNPKHAFRFYFREEYGDSRLRYAAVWRTREPTSSTRSTCGPRRTTPGRSRSDSTATTSCATSSRATCRERWDSPYKRGEYYHLYINGQYWGLFQTDERIGADYGSIYFGGEDEDYDVVHNNPRDNAAIDGNLDAYRRLWERVRQGRMA